MAKRVLMISWRSYPCNQAGAHRASQLAKYLPRLGWEPVLLTVDWRPENCGTYYDPGLAALGEYCRTIRVPYRSSTSPFARLARCLLPYRFPISTYRTLVARGHHLLSREHFDVIWASFPPGIVLRVAHGVSRRHDVPWVADFRDLPDQFRSGWAERVKVKLEKRLCASSSCLVTVSRALAERLASRHPQTVVVIPHGFDPDDFPLRPPRPSGVFSISYFGVVYADPAVGQNPSLLFDTLDLLAGPSGDVLSKVRVRFYGTDPALIRSLVRGRRCERIVSAPSRLNHKEMIRRMQDSTVLLLLTCGDAKGIPLSKLSHYLAARRPILAVPGDGDVVDQVLAKTGSGVSASTPAAIADTLLTWYTAWVATGSLPNRGIEGEINNYSRVTHARLLADIFDALARSSSALRLSPCCPDYQVSARVSRHAMRKPRTARMH